MLPLFLQAWRSWKSAKGVALLAAAALAAGIGTMPAWFRFPVGGPGVVLWQCVQIADVIANQATDRSLVVEVDHLSGGTHGITRPSINVIEQATGRRIDVRVRQRYCWQVVSAGRHASVNAN